MLISTPYELQSWLSEFLVQTDLDWQHRLHKAVSLIGEKKQLLVFLDSILRDPKQLSKCASQSYAHSNGFDKIVLLSSEQPQYKLRFHIWWPQPNNTDNLVVEHIHNHRWEFSSLLLNGRYRHQEFQSAQDGEILHQYEYLPPGETTTFSLKYIGPKRLLCVFDCAMQAGTQYTISHSVLHRVTSDRNHCTVSLFLQGPDRKSSTDVFTNELTTTSEQNFSVSRFTASNLAEKLKILNSVLSS